MERVCCCFGVVGRRWGVCGSVGRVLLGAPFSSCFIHLDTGEDMGATGTAEALATLRVIRGSDRGVLLLCSGFCAPASAWSTVFGPSFRPGRAVSSLKAAVEIGVVVVMAEAGLVAVVVFRLFAIGVSGTSKAADTKPNCSNFFFG